MANELVIRNGLVSKGDITFPITVKGEGSSYTLTNDDYSVVVDVNENFTITIPSSATTLTGNIFTFKNLSNSNNLILTTEDTQVEIDNSLSDYTIGPLQSVQIQATGSEWVVNGQSGTSGISGIDGAISTRYEYVNLATGDPGSDKMYINASGFAFSDTNVDSVNVNSLLDHIKTLGISGHLITITVTDVNDPTTFITKTVTGISDLTGYWGFFATTVDSNNTFTDGDLVSVSFSIGGVDGTSGSSGSSGTSGSSGSSGTSGSSGSSGTSGSSGSSGTSGSSGSSGTSGSSGSSGTSGSSGSSGTSGVGGSEGCLSQTLNSTQSANPTAYNLSFNSTTFSGTQSLKFNYGAKVTGLPVPLSFRNLNNSYVGTQGYVILTEKGGTKYVTYTYSSFESNTSGGYYELKVVHVNSSGTPSISDEYCITLIELI